MGLLAAGLLGALVGLAFSFAVGLLRFGLGLCYVVGCLLCIRFRDVGFLMRFGFAGVYCLYVIFYDFLGFLVLLLCIYMLWFWVVDCAFWFCCGVVFRCDLVFSGCDFRCFFGV